MLFINKNDWWSAAIKASLLVAVTSFFVFEVGLSEKPVSMSLLYNFMFASALFFIGPLVALLPRYRASALSIFLMGPALVAVAYVLGDPRKDYALSLAVLPTFLALPKVFFERIRSEESGGVLSAIGGGILGLLSATPLMLLMLILLGFSEIGDPEIMKKNGIRHAQETIIPELWLDQYPSEKIQIEDAYYELFEDFTAGATFKVDSSIDLHQYVQDYPKPRSGEWEWRPVRDASGKIIRYQALIGDSVQVDEFTHELWVSLHDRTSFVVDLAQHQIMYSDSGE